MKKLVIHIGYPKTATTTLQEGLFYGLHCDGLINYIGRVNPDTNNKLYNNTSYYFECLINNEKPHPDKISIIDNKINIFSSERHLIYSPEKIIKSMRSQSARQINPYIIPQRIKNLYEDICDEIIFIVVLRNQKSFIHSLYVQHYNRHYIYDKKLNTWDKFFDRNIKKGKAGGFLRCYYYDILKNFSDVFGKDKIHVLFYEDFINDQEFFIRKLSEIINIDEKLAKSKIDGKHYNKISKNDKGCYSKPLKIVYKNNYAGKLIKYIHKRMGIKTTGSRFIPYPTNEQKEKIYNEFQDSNYKLADFFDLDKEKLEKYGYI